MCTRKSSRRAAIPAAALIAIAASAHAATLQYFGDTMKSAFAEGSERTELVGHAQVQTEDMRIIADRIELYGKDLVFAMCTGNVKVVNTKRGMEVTSESLFYDRQQKIARINGNAVMQDFKNEMVVKGGFIEDRDKEQITIMQIGVRILKKDMVCRSEFARFDRSTNLLDLSGMPWVSRKGDEYRAARISVNTDTEEITLEGDVKGQITTSGEKSPETTGAEPPADQSAPDQGQGGEAVPAAPPATPQPAPGAQPATPHTEPEEGGAVGG